MIPLPPSVTVGALSEPGPMTAARFNSASSLDDFIESAAEHAGLWRAIATRVRAANLPPEIDSRARAVPTPRNLLVLLEDWCGDAINTVPVIDALASRIPGFTLRVLSRDQNDDLMQAHLSPLGKRAIPVVIVYDGNFRELGWWGSRPGALQAWTLSSEAASLTKADRYAFVRRWYVRDRGLSTLEELLRVLEIPDSN